MPYMSQSVVSPPRSYVEAMSDRSIANRNRTLLTQSPQLRRGGGKRRAPGSPNGSSNKVAKCSSVDSLGAYSRLISDLRSNNSQDLVLFRGHRNFDRPLLPKIGRGETRLKGGRQSDLPDVEKRLFGNFKRFGLPFLHIRPEDELDWLAIAQHHGLPTRLLDWTGNALAALWFAVRCSPIKENGVLRPGAVWVLNPRDKDFFERIDRVKPFTVTSAKVYRPKHITQRLIAQAGYFTLHPLDRATSRFKPLTRNATLEGEITKISIPPNAFCDLRDDLERLGVSDLTMFPDLDGICRFITWNASLLEDEHDPPNVLLNQ